MPKSRQVFGKSCQKVWLKIRFCQNLKMLLANFSSKGHSILWLSARNFILQCPVWASEASEKILDSHFAKNFFKFLARRNFCQNLKFLRNIPSGISQCCLDNLWVWRPKKHEWFWIYQTYIRLLIQIQIWVNSNIWEYCHPYVDCNTCLQ